MKKQSLDEPTRLIVYSELRKIVPLSRSSLWRMERNGDFPKRRLLTKGRVAWLLSEVTQWIEERTRVGGDAKPAHNLPAKPKASPSQEPIRRPFWANRDDD